MNEISWILSSVIFFLFPFFKRGLFQKEILGVFVPKIWLSRYTHIETKQSVKEPTVGIILDLINSLFIVIFIFYLISCVDVTTT